ncbi:MAG: hypothetical protein M3680_07740 [Myxococcota bacterium]|nr:hypothetical protein [Myxococcota bacterium]
MQEISEFLTTHRDGLVEHWTHKVRHGALARPTVTEQQLVDSMTCSSIR